MLVKLSLVEERDVHTKLQFEKSRNYVQLSMA